MITVNLNGRLTRDMEVRELNNNTKLCTFTVASDRPYKTKDGQRPTDFIDVKCFVPEDREVQIEHRTPALRKGQMVFIMNAPLEVEKYDDKDGNARKNAVVRIRSLYDVMYDGRSLKDDADTEEAPF